MTTWASEKTLILTFCDSMNLADYVDRHQWCRQDFQLTGSEYCFYPQNLKNPMEHWNTVVCFSKIDGFENPPQKIDGFGRTRRTPSDDSTDKFITGSYSRRENDKTLSWNSIGEIYFNVLKNISWTWVIFHKGSFHDGALNKLLVVKKSDKLPYDSSFYSIRGPWV